MRNIPLPQNSFMRALALLKRRSNACFYVRGAFIYGLSSTQTKQGWWFTHGPLMRVSVDATASEKGKMLLSCLSNSGSENPELPTATSAFDLDTSGFPELKRVKSWSDFSRGALNCSVAFHGISLHFLPTRNMRKSRFEFLPDQEITVTPFSSVSRLGSALTDCFSRCRLV
jgi:hypothetical protein